MVGDRKQALAKPLQGAEQRTVRVFSSAVTGHGQGSFNSTRHRQFRQPAVSAVNHCLHICGIWCTCNIRSPHAMAEGAAINARTQRQRHVSAGAAHVTLCAGNLASKVTVLALCSTMLLKQRETGEGILRPQKTLPMTFKPA